MDSRSKTGARRQETGHHFTVMLDLCAYPPCKCMAPDGEIFCGDICAMLGAGLVNQVRTSSALPLKPDEDVVPRCACGHAGCGDSLVSGEVN
jgi:hypothetical protein